MEKKNFQNLWKDCTPEEFAKNAREQNNFGRNY